MFILMVVIFILGYTAIALEHPLKIDKAASAILLGVIMWVLFFIGRSDILSMVNGAGEHISKSWEHYLHMHGPEENNPLGMIHFQRNSPDSIHYHPRMPNSWTICLIWQACTFR